MSYAISTQHSFIRKGIVYVLLYICTIAIITSTFFLTPHLRGEFPLLRLVIILCATILLSKYFIYMVVSPWYEVVLAYKQERLSEKKTAYLYPRVSVLIPAWNEEVGVITTIRTLLLSTYKNLEIVVINNASTDNTGANVQQLIETYYAEQKSPKNCMEILYALEKNQGKGHALNTGLSLSTGEIIVSIDADCSVPPETIAHFVKHFYDKEVMAAVGNVRIGDTTHLLGVVQYLEFLFSFYFKKADALMNTIYIIGGAAGAFRKEVFEVLGPYSLTNITEDIELSVRIQNAGMKIAYASDAIVYTEGATTLNGLMKQRLRWKRGRFETFVEHKRLFFSTRKEHRKLLTLLILPLSLFGELQLFFEIFFIVFLFVFSYLMNDYSSFISGVAVVSSMFVVQIAFDNHKETRLSFLLLAPIGWLLFYASTFVESQALVKAVWGYARGSEVKWQKWERNGVFKQKTL